MNDSFLPSLSWKNEKIASEAQCFLSSHIEVRLQTGLFLLILVYKQVNDNSSLDECIGEPLHTVRHSVQTHDRKLGLGFSLLVTKWLTLSFSISAFKRRRAVSCYKHVRPTEACKEGRELDM